MFFIIIITYKKIKKFILHAPAFSNYGRRTFLSSFFNKSLYKGSLTLEAAIVFPIYILFLISIIYILNILALQNSLQMSMEETSRSISSSAYISEKICYMKEKGITTNLTYSVLNTALIKQLFLNDELKNLSDNSYIVNGSNGISFQSTYTNTNTHIVDFNITYNVSIPFLPDNIFKIRINQRCRFRTFSGEDISDKSGEYTPYVYTASNAGVYHSSPYCSYLSKYYTILPSSSFDNMGDSNNKYSACSHCARNVPMASNVFNCPGSMVYHNSIDCFYLNANVHKVTLESVEDFLSLCSRCKKGVN